MRRIKGKSMISLNVTKRSGKCMISEAAGIRTGCLFQSFMRRRIFRKEGERYGENIDSSGKTGSRS